MYTYIRYCWYAYLYTSALRYLLLSLLSLFYIIYILKPFAGAPESTAISARFGRRRRRAFAFHRIHRSASPPMNITIYIYYDHHRNPRSVRFGVRGPAIRIFVLLLSHVSFCTGLKITAYGRFSDRFRRTFGSV